MKKYFVLLTHTIRLIAISSDSENNCFSDTDSENDCFFTDSENDCFSDTDSENDCFFTDSENGYFFTILVTIHINCTITITDSMPSFSMCKKSPNIFINQSKNH